MGADAGTVSGAIPRPRFGRPGRTPLSGGFHGGTMILLRGVKPRRTERQTRSNRLASSEPPCEPLVEPPRQPPTALSHRPPPPQQCYPHRPVSCGSVVP